MTSEQFKAELLKDKESIEITGVQLEEYVSITEEVKASQVVIRNCSFSDLAFIRICIGSLVEIVDCKFSNSLKFQACKSNKSEDFNNSNTCNLVISNTQINFLNIQGECCFEHGFKICDKSSIDSIYIRDFTVKLGNFHVSNSVVNNKFEIIKTNISHGIRIGDSSEIKSNLVLSSIKAKIAGIINSSVYKNISIRDIEVDNFVLNGVTLEDEVHIEGINFAKDLRIMNSSLHKDVVFDIKSRFRKNHASINGLIILSTTFSSKMIINGQGTALDSVNISMSNKLEGTIYLTSLNIGRAQINGNNYATNLVFKSCTYNRVSLVDLHNTETISFISGKAMGAASQLEIVDSNIGKTQFFDFDFSSFQDVVIKNAILIDLVATQVTWFENSSLNTQEVKSKKGFIQRKEVYRQLKYVLEKQGDRVGYLKFKALEMSVYKEKVFASIVCPWDVFNQEVIVLWLGQTNNFGLSWWKPTWIALLFTFIFYILIIPGVSSEISYIPCVFSSQAWKITIGEYVSYSQVLPQLLNPTHLLSRMFAGSDIAFGAYFFDALQKIFHAFFIFQIIAAFRKYMKS